MRKLLRHVRTGEYFDLGRWTRDLQQAQHFRTAAEILRTCRQFNLQDVEIVLVFDGLKQKFNIALKCS